MICVSYALRRLARFRAEEGKSNPPSAKADKINNQTALGDFNAQMKHRDPGAYGVRRFPFSDALPFLLDRQRKRFLAFARNDGTGKTVFSHRFLSHAGKALVRGCGSPSFLWKEVPRRGGGWLSQRNKKEWVRSIFPYRPPKCS